MTKVKQRKCKNCPEKYTPTRPMQTACSIPCAIELGRKAKEKAQAVKVKAERATDRVKKESMKGLPELLKEAQVAFNTFIRARDQDKGCFVCGEAFGNNWLGGAYDAGHARSVGAAGHLRFTEDNCFGECKPCNAPTGAKPHQIKEGAIRRIGQARWDELENDNTPKKWAREEVRAIRDEYRDKAAKMKKDRQSA